MAMAAAGVFPIVVVAAAGVSFFVVVVALEVGAGRESSGEISQDASGSTAEKDKQRIHPSSLHPESLW